MYRLSPPALPCPVLVRQWRLHLRPAAILLGTVGLLLSLAVSARSDELRLPVQTPEAAGMDGAQLRTIDGLVAEGIAAGEMPGCVVLIARRGGIVWLKAYGNRQVEPQSVAMTTDTVFDLASLTKPVATATSVMKLVDEGRLRLDDRVAKHIPEFGQNGKQDVTVYDLLIHQSGLTPANSLRDFDDGPQRTWERIFALGVRAEPGTKFSYSDVGYLVLAELVRRVSGQDIHEFSRDRIYQPLGMRETGYLPGEALRERAAPTERRGEQWMRGEVHDPRAFLLGGVAGHAGLFSTAEDLAVYAQMMLDRGRRGEVRVLSERAVAEMTAGYPVPDALRGLGWDVRSGYSSNRGAAFSSSAFGHGGFTGTAMWIDPQLELIVIFLSNRLHPDGRGSVNRLAGRIGSVAAAAITDRPKPAVLTGDRRARGCEKIGQAPSRVPVFAASARSQSHFFTPSPRRLDHQPDRHQPRRRHDHPALGRGERRGPRRAVQSRARLAGPLGRGPHRGRAG
jgi:CubicO group peptidase (beta-lactamase class C family)